MPHGFLKHKIVFSYGKKRFFRLFAGVFLIALIIIIGIGFFSPVVRSGLHRIAGVFLRMDSPRGEQKFLFPAGVATAVEDIFSDVPPGHPHARAIAELKKRGFIHGYSDGSFQPEKSLSRAEAVEMLIVFRGIEPNLVNFAHCFEDVGQEWFARSVCYAKEKKWVSGYPNGTFKPLSNVTKVEADKLFSAAVRNGFKPFRTDIENDKNITRAEFAEWIYNVLVGKSP